LQQLKTEQENQIRQRTLNQQTAEQVQQLSLKDIETMTEAERKRQINQINKNNQI
jgi:hypothetical protein